MVKREMIIKMNKQKIKDFALSIINVLIDLGLTVAFFAYLMSLKKHDDINPFLNLFLAAHTLGYYLYLFYKPCKCAIVILYNLYALASGKEIKKGYEPNVLKRALLIVLGHLNIIYYGPVTLFRMAGDGPTTTTLYDEYGEEVGYIRR